MCFSASASFAVAAATGVVGTVTLARASDWRERPIAAMPLMFSMQQAIEGTLWSQLEGGRGLVLTGPLVTSFAFLALVLWPIWTPIAAGLIERDKLRRVLMFGLFVGGLLVSVSGFSHISARPYTVCIVNLSLLYSNGLTYSSVEMAGYIIVATIPLLISSHRALRYFGSTVAIGLAVSAAAYLATSLSVWCFFASIASVMIYLHFRGLAQQRIA
jgi:hypothetical protein